MRFRGLPVIGISTVLATSYCVASPVSARTQTVPAQKAQDSNTEPKSDDADLAAYPRRLSVPVGTGSILIKAPRTVRPGALTKCRDKLRVILRDADPDVVERLGQSGLVVILAPHMGRFTDIPDLRDLRDFRNAFDQPLDQARGIFRSAERPLPDDAKPNRPTRDHPLLVVGEEDILRLVPCGPQSALHHEFAHAIHHLALTVAQRASWRERFADAQRRGLFKKRYASLNEDEFFAEFTEAYFDVAPYFCSKGQLARVDRASFDWLANVYSFRLRQQQEVDTASEKK